MASPTLCAISSRPETTAQLLCARSSETRGASLARTWSEALWSFVKTSGAQKSDCFGNSNAADITPTTVYGVLSNAIVLPMTAGSDPNRLSQRRWLKTPAFTQHAQAEVQILREILNPIYAARVAAFLFGLLDAFQVESRAAVRLFLPHALRYVFFGFSFEVVAQLVVQFLGRLRPAKQRPQPQRNRV